MKNYLEQNVYDATIDRIKYVFDNFEKVYVSFSGGKDSSVLLNLALHEAKKRNKKLGVLFIDLEGQYKQTISYIQQVLEDNAEHIDPYWVCLPLNLRNAVSVYEPFWCCWDPSQKDKWVRELPDYPVINDPNFFPFFRYRMEFEEFIIDFSKWYAKGEKTCCMVGIRSDESLNRFRTIASKSKVAHEDKQWTTKIDNDVFNAYPIYDWRTEDIWIVNGKNNYPYNPLYDMFYRAGVGIHQMRICQPYGDDQRIGLNLFRIIEPETWSKVVNRVSGANFGNIYCGTKAIGFRNVKLPKGHTWKSYTKLLLASLPPESSANYIEHFMKFMRHWNKKGCGLPNEIMDKLPKSAIITDSLATRGNKNKYVVRYKKIEDNLPAEIEGNRYAPTWRRMAMCILKNDHLCKGLSFGQTKRQAERQKALLEKYKDL